MATYEKAWIDLTINAPFLIDNMLKEYNLLVGETTLIDDTPETLKAVLFNRYTHGHPYWTKPEFKTWYRVEYLKVD